LSPGEEAAVEAAPDGAARVGEPVPVAGERIHGA
jgi:hypothetical protein